MTCDRPAQTLVCTKENLNRAQTCAATATQPLLEPKPVCPPLVQTHARQRRNQKPTNLRNHDNAPSKIKKTERTTTSSRCPSFAIVGHLSSLLSALHCLKITNNDRSKCSTSRGPYAGYGKRTRNSIHQGGITKNWVSRECGCSQFG